VSGWPVAPGADLPQRSPGQPRSFAAVQGLHAEHMARAPARAAIEKRNERLLAGFDKDALKEAEEEAKERLPKK
jgi:hypothetical protein